MSRGTTVVSTPQDRVESVEYRPTAVELGVGEQLHKLRPVLRPDMVACA